MEAAAAGWRVTGLVTVVASRALSVWLAATVRVRKGSAHSDWESPATTMENPELSTWRAQAPYAVRSSGTFPVPNAMDAPMARG